MIKGPFIGCIFTPVACQNSKGVASGRAKEWQEGGHTWEEMQRGSERARGTVSSGSSLGCDAHAPDQIPCLGWHSLCHVSYHFSGPSSGGVLN